MKTDDLMPKAEKIKTPVEELEILAQLADSVYFQILKRVARRYVELLKTQSFSLRAEDPHFAVKHTRYIEQAVGMEQLIKLISGAGHEKAKREKGEDDESTA